MSELGTQDLTAVIGVQAAIAASALALQDVMDLVVEHAVRLTAADGAVIELVEGDEMVYRAVAGSAAPHLGVRLDRASSLSGRSVVSGRVLRCDDSEIDDRV